MRSTDREGTNENLIVMRIVLEANMYMGNNRGKERKNELEEGSRKNSQAFKNVKEMARLRKSFHRLKVVAKSRDMTSVDQDGVKDHDEEGICRTATDIAIDLDSKEPRTRKTKFGNEVHDGISFRPNRQKCRNLKSQDTEDDIENRMMDKEMSIEKLESKSEHRNEVRLRFVNIRETDLTDTEKYRSCLVKSKHRKSLSPNATDLQECKAVRKNFEEEVLPNTGNEPRIQSLPTMGVTLCTGHLVNGEDADFDSLNNDDFDHISLKQDMIESRWRNLLEELYSDKKYFDYVKRTKTPTESNILAKAMDGLDFLYERAAFWEQQDPIPPRPTSYIFEKHRYKILYPGNTITKTVATERNWAFSKTQVSGFKKLSQNSLAEARKADKKQVGKISTDEWNKPTGNQLKRDANTQNYYYSMERERKQDFTFEPDKTSLSRLPKRETLGNIKDVPVTVNTDVWEQVSPTNVKDERFSRNKINVPRIIKNHVKRTTSHNAADNIYSSRKEDNFHENTQLASQKPSLTIRNRITSSFMRKKEPESHPRAKSAGDAVQNTIFDGEDW